jgi:hypothetical protein
MTDERTQEAAAPIARAPRAATPIAAADATYCEPPKRLGGG